MKMASTLKESAHRMARKTSISHLARLSGVSQASLYQWLHGQRQDITLRTASRLADALGVSLQKSSFFRGERKLDKKAVLSGGGSSAGLGAK